jgi:hypothetical protein
MPIALPFSHKARQISAENWSNMKSCEIESDALKKKEKEIVSRYDLVRSHHFVVFVV